MRKTALLYLALITAAIHSPAQAQLFKCKGADGSTRFQGTPCAVPGAGARSDIPKVGDKDPNFAARSNKPDANWAANRVAIVAPPTGTVRYPAAVSGAETARPAAAPVSGGQRQSDYEISQIRERNEITEANNKRVARANRENACTAARNNLGVLSDNRPVFSYNNKGERVFVPDESRAAKKAEAQNRVNAACN